ncbi:CRISPR-associated endonuclease Cas2 [Lutibacter maritimus]|uniref:CRISPR-associated endoribonuclease Cas2 n=1 Tax=Lutibacter maritimus TaxID=593133 RepID=A0A1I6SRI9_9FLAO|nr:CRISPR-associated endonuclease Cas2 [Lutibacter maritimus]SFS79448.1 CRISPR-associated endonuclease Cas2 [Lutibacter maritimus]
MYLLFYDITENNLRTKISKLLIETGYERLQLSVFVAPYNPLNNKVWQKIKMLLINTPTNKVYCIKLTNESFYNIKIIGNLEIDLKYLAGDLSSLIV